MRNLMSVGSNLNQGTCIFSFNPTEWLGDIALQGLSTCESCQYNVTCILKFKSLNSK